MSAATKLPDWRAIATEAVRTVFGGLTNGHIRRPLVLAIARARTPEEAGDLMGEEAAKLPLDINRRLEIAAIIASLRSRAAWEAEL